MLYTLICRCIDSETCVAIYVVETLKTRKLACLNKHDIRVMRKSFFRKKLDEAKNDKAALAASANQNKGAAADLQNKSVTAIPVA